MLFFLFSCFETAVADKPTDEMCRHYRKWKKSGISTAALQQGLTYYKQNNYLFDNHTSIAIADYSLSSKKRRFFVFSWEDGAVHKVQVSHGSGKQDKQKWGDLDNDGMLDTCDKDGDQTNMTRVGFFKVGNYYLSENHDPTQWPDLIIEGEEERINGLQLMGLSVTNSEAFSRGVVMHEAMYNAGAAGRQMGKSFGCPAFRPEEGSKIMPLFHHGGMYYSYAPQCETQHQKVLASIPNWEKTCTVQ